MTSDPRTSRALWWVLLGAIVAAGGLLRWRAAHGDLWFDEVWSMLLTTRAHSLAGVFTEIHHANNHYLNTAYLMLVGSGLAPEVYRLPAVLAGTAAIGLMTMVSATWEAGAGRGPLTSAWLAASSFFLVQYSSEARGYGLALCCALLCYLATASWVSQPRWISAVAMAVAAILGMASHLTMVFIVTGCLAWIAVAAWNRRTRGESLTDWSLAAIIFPPGAFAAWLWMNDLRVIDSGGGSPWRGMAVLRETVRSTLNLPAGPLELLGVLALIGAAWETVGLYRAREARWAFFATVIFAIPSFVSLVASPEYLVSRYFLVSAPFLLVLAGEWLARVSALGKVGLLAWALTLVAFPVGGAALWGPLLRDGRGHYTSAVAYVAAATVEPVVRIASDHDLRNGLLLAYFGHGLAPGRRLEYVQQDEWSTRSFEWFIVHRTADEDPPSPVLALPSGRFLMATRFDYAGLSGWNWFVYRKERSP